ncbi:TAXI family TRAP transporter solute-binding subunit [Desulfovibrio sp. OttesenSCG-928-C14]|nr:TAXI family TRAP transporter solute-binding subunit [Desulfovibrio sp. OttesenSCG-928-C14]
MKKLLGITALLTALFCMAGAAIAAQAQTKLTIYSAPFGRTGYIMGSACEDIIKRSSTGISITQEEGFGMIYNIKKLESASKEERKGMIIMGTLTSMWQAQSGKPPFKKKTVPDMRILFNMYLSTSLFMTRDPNIKSVEDFAGKIVAIGQKSQDVYGTFLWDHINVGYNMGNKVNVQWIGNAAAISSFKDGLANVSVADVLNNAVTGEAVAGPASLELQASFDDVRFIGSSKEALDRVIAKTGIPYTIVSMPAGTFANQTETILTLGTPNFWAASLEMPEDVAYGFVKAIIDNVGAFETYHAAGRLITREALCYGLSKEMLHPGAYRAYKEAGLMK